MQSFTIIRLFSSWMIIMPTLREVADLAGVSTATVSRVLNEYPYIHDDTRKRVLKAIKQLDYRPSRVARRLRKKGAQILGLVIADVSNPYYTAVIQSIENIAHAHKYSMLLCNSGEDPNRERIHINILLEEQVAGIIISPVDEESISCEAFLRQGIPVVAIDRRFRNLKLDSVLVDNSMGAYEATCHLIRLGHKRIGLIAGPSRLTTGRERQAGYEKALNENGLGVDPDLIEVGDFKQQSGYTKACDLLNRQDRPTALFVSNNLMTLGALNAIHDIGLRIPQDIAIVGFDDLSWAPSINPPLTAVAQPTYELGKWAANLLLGRLSERDKEPVEIILKPSLIVRVSCGHKKNGN
jgi:DNA-binding LacI/PurR family transcriptional regulator